MGLTYPLDGTISSPLSSIPYLPNEVIVSVLEYLRTEEEGLTGNCLDDYQTQQFILSLRQVSKTWDSLVLEVFFHDTQITTGLFPTSFTPLYPATGIRVERHGYEDEDEDDEYEDDLVLPFGHEIQLLNRSGYFLSFDHLSLICIRSLTVDASCTIGDNDPECSYTFNREFAIAAMGCVALEKLTIRAHGMSRLDHPDDGLDAWFTTWNLEAGDEAEDEEEEGEQAELVELADGSREVWYYYGKDKHDEPTQVQARPRRPAPLFPNLRELSVCGYTDATTLSTTGTTDLLHFIWRHGETLNSIRLENIGRRDERIRPSMAHDTNDDGDAKEAYNFWSTFRKNAWEVCGGLSELTMKMMSYVIVRSGPVVSNAVSQQAQLLDHSSTHNDDWPWETDVRLSYVEELDTIVSYQIQQACGCRHPVFVDPEAGEGIDFVAESHRFFEPGKKTKESV
ncbi:hypothetical protein TWF718_010915 [Orbilia javanica]|uniref:F-box domain-containing protein n=1 Tax=Orbilia javanica TaxID=47235 RepID=A0AAN8RK79_9PEZI